MIELLDHGHIQLVDHLGSDLSVVRNARVSYDAEWRAGEDAGSDKRLINYLYKNGHNTPFECAVVTFDVKAPIFVLRQWMRHRTQSYNELSARYKELPVEFYVPKPEHVGVQSTDNKQMRDIDEQGSVPEDNYEIVNLMRHQNETAFALYKRMIEKGVPRELARTVLPVTTYSHMFATVNLHNLFGFLRERTHEHAQYEIRVYAESVLELIRPKFPVCVEAFESGR